MANTPIAERVRQHRVRHRGTGLRLSRQRWVYDMRDPQMLARFQSASEAITTHADTTEHEAEVERWCDAVRCTEGWG